MNRSRLIDQITRRVTRGLKYLQGGGIGKWRHRIEPRKHPASGRESPWLTFWHRDRASLWLGSEFIDLRRAQRVARGLAADAYQLDRGGTGGSIEDIMDGLKNKYRMLRYNKGPRPR